MPGLREGAMELYGERPVAIVPSSSSSEQIVQHSIPPSLGLGGGPGRRFRVSISWGLGNELRLSYFPASNPSPPGGVGALVVGLSLGTLPLKSKGSTETNPSSSDSVDGEEDDAAEHRRIAYESMPAFARLQSHAQSLFGSGSPRGALSSDWWENVLEYSRSISGILGPNQSSSASAFKNPHEATKENKTPTVLKSIWDLLEIFYVDRNASSWLSERLVDWLEDNDRVLARSNTTHSKLADFQMKLLNMRFPEDAREYWDNIASALAVGWLDVATSLLRMHGSYQHDQIDDRQVENGLVEALAILISKMPRLRPSVRAGSLGVAFGFKPDFSNAWNRWRSQVAKLNLSPFWGQCSHQETLAGLKNVLRLLLGDIEVLVAATSHWMELLVGHFLFVRPLSMISEGMLSLARKCVQLKPATSSDYLVELMLAILGDNTEVVLAQSSRLFDPWMVTHMLELLSAKSVHSQALLQDEKQTLGGISLEELHRLVYAQVLSSHPITWQLAPVYLASCPRQGLGLLEKILLMQPIKSQNQLCLKALEVCRVYELHGLAESIMRVAGVYHWKHGKKGAGVSWFQRAQDNRRLSAISHQLVTNFALEKDIDKEKSQELEGLIELLDSGNQVAGGLSFLHRYCDFKVSLRAFQEIQLKDRNDSKLTSAGKQVAEILMQLMKTGAAPPTFWLTLLNDSVDLLEYPHEVLLNASQTHLLMMRLEELSLLKLRGDLLNASIKPSDDLRLALARNLGRALLKE